MSDGYDVTELDRAVSWGLTLSERTEWRGGVHRYVFSDVRIEQMLAAEFGVDGGAAMGMLRAGRVRLLRAPLDRPAYRVGKRLGYRTSIS